MAEIRPFTGLRFSGDAGNIADLVAPPYDVISPEERAHLAAKNPNNVVHITLPESSTDDRSKFVKYARSAAKLEEWRRNQMVRKDEKSTYYRYTQTYLIPGTDQTLTRTSIIALIKIEPYEKGVVLPHEQTFPKHKEDRLRILEATGSHLECIFGLFEDDGGESFKIIESAKATEVADLVTPEDGIHHILETIDDPESVDAITQSIADNKVWIADGHHRYETALTFRSMQPESEGRISADYMMMALCSMSDPGLVLLPTHRILKTLPCSPEELKSRMAEQFDLQDCPNTQLMSTIAAQGPGSFGVALPGGTGFVAKAKDRKSLAALSGSDGSELLRLLDVTVLHSVIFEKMLGLTGVDFFGYTRIEQEALEAVENGSPASFLMNPPSVEDMRLVALGGEKMPQKSTYYYPKLLSGLVIWSLKDF